MRPDLIETLRCPYTGSAFSVAAAARESDQGIEFGVVRSEGGDFPIVGGILRLLPDRLQEPLVDLVRQGRFELARLAALDVPYPTRWGSLAESAIRMARLSDPRRPFFISNPNRRRLNRLITQPGATFSDRVSEAGPEGWSQWQSYRFSMPTFLPVYPLAHLARGRRRILDFGCGLGHSTFLMQRLAGDAATIIAADYSFTSLALAKRFLVPGSPCICLDGDFPMPFPDKHFDLVFSTDAMQYIESKVALARDFGRILTRDGTIALAHLHNRLSPSRTGKSLTPVGYDGIFAGMRRRLYPEESLVADYVADGVLDLDKRHSPDDLNRQLRGVSVVAAHADAAFTTRTGLCDAYIDAMRHPHLNPIYRAQPGAGSMALERGIGEPFAIGQTVQGIEVLPQTWRVGVPSLERQAILAMRDRDRPALRELIRRFLVLDMPEAFYA